MSKSILLRADNGVLRKQVYDGSEDALLTIDDDGDIWLYTGGQSEGRKISGGAPVTIEGKVAIGSILQAVLAPGWTYTSIQWMREVNGVVSEIAGATGPQYQMSADDVAPGARVFATTAGLSYAAAGVRSPVLELQIFGTPPSSAVAGVSFSFPTNIVGGVPPYARNIAGPAGAVHDENGVSWPNPIAGNHNFEVGVTDALGTQAQMPPFTLSVIAGVLVPANTTLPTITGTAQVGNALMASSGVWTNSPSTFAYQWLRDGTPVSGATSSTYSLSGADVGSQMSVRVIASNGLGAGAPATSAATAAVTAAPVAVPVNSTPPTITGTAQVGQTLTAGNGTWTNSPTSYAYQWRRAGTPIGGATAQTYVPVTGDIGSTLTVAVIASNASGPSASAAVSSATAAVVATAEPVAIVAARTANVTPEADNVYIGLAGAASSAGLVMATAYLPANTEGWAEFSCPAGLGPSGQDDAAASIGFDADPAETLVVNSNDRILTVSTTGGISVGVNTAPTSVGTQLPGPGVRHRVRRDATGQFMAEKTVNGGTSWEFVANIGSPNTGAFFLRFYTTYATYGRRLYNPRTLGLSVGATPVFVLNSNGIQGQWVDETAKTSADGLYDMISSASDAGAFVENKRVKSSGAITRVTLATNEADDHNDHAKIQLPSGIWMRLWNRHSIVGTTGFMYSKSTTADGIEVGTPVNVPGGDQPSYLSAWLVGTRLWVLYRVGNSDTGVWVIRYSDDPAATTPTWSAEVQLTPTAYLDVKVTGTTMYGVMYNHPVSGANHHLYELTINLSTGAVTTGGVAAGNVLTGDSLPVPEASARRAVVVSSGTSRLFGQSYDGQYIYYGKMGGATGSIQYYRGVRTAGTAAYTEQLIVGGGRAFLEASQAYFGGHCHIDSNTVACCINRSGAAGVGNFWTLEIWKTADSGATWTFDRTVTTRADAIVARVRTLGNMLMWSEMSAYATFTSFTSRLVATLLP